MKNRVLRTFKPAQQTRLNAKELQPGNTNTSLGEKPLHRTDVDTYGTIESPKHHDKQEKEKTLYGVAMLV